MPEPDYAALKEGTRTLEFNQADGDATRIEAEYLLAVARRRG